MLGNHGELAAGKPPAVILDVLNRLALGPTGPPLELELVREAFAALLIATSRWREAHLAAFLYALMARGPTVDEICVLIEEALRLDGLPLMRDRKLRPVLPASEVLVGAVGSGKKGSPTINISTPAGLLAAALGVHFVKPGSKSVSSMLGSANLLQSLGVNIELSLDGVCRLIEKTRFGFTSIERTVPRFDAVYGGRFYVPHALSFALPGVLCPLYIDRLLYGLSHPDVMLSARVFSRLGFPNVLVGTTTDDGRHFIDEVGIGGTTTVIGVRGSQLGELRTFRPAELLGIESYTLKDLMPAESLEGSVRLVVQVLKGRGPTPYSLVIAMNAGTLLYLAGKSPSLADAFKETYPALLAGHGFIKLSEVVEESGGNMDRLRRLR